jgi:hypothetical protein
VSQSTALTWHAASLDATFLGIDRISPPASDSAKRGQDHPKKTGAIDIPFRKTGNALHFQCSFGFGPATKLSSDRHLSIFRHCRISGQARQSICSRIRRRKQRSSSTWGREIAPEFLALAERPKSALSNWWPSLGGTWAETYVLNLSRNLSRNLMAANLPHRAIRESPFHLPPRCVVCAR